MKTISQLRRVVEQAGARLEEDEPLRDMRTFQAVAPDGMIWEEGCFCMRVDWATGASPQAVRFNEEQFKSVSERVASGLREQTEAERDMCAVD